jgi:hypothetical protein
MNHPHQQDEDVAQEDLHGETAYHWEQEETGQEQFEKILSYPGTSEDVPAIVGSSAASDEVVAAVDAVASEPYSPEPETGPWQHDSYSVPEPPSAFLDLQSVAFVCQR